LLWTASGLIFSWNSIEAVRGEHLIRTQENVSLINFQFKGIDEILSDSANGFEDSICVSATLRTMLGRPVYEFRLENGESATFELFDAISGKKISPVNEETAKAIALADFSPKVEVQSIELMESAGPHSEYRGKELPAYRVVLDHSSGTVIYVSTKRGIVTTRRNNRWRIFDFFWMLHTMDYQGRDNFNHWVLKGVSVFGLVTVLSGFVLWFKTSRLFSRWNTKRKTTSAKQVPLEKD
jgi:uncharacterized membrane protein YkoI